MNLDELEAKLGSMLAAGTEISLQAADLGLPELPRYLWPKTGTFKLAEAEFQRLTPVELSISGGTTLSVLGQVTAKLLIKVQPEISLQTDLELANPVRLGDLLKEALPALDSMENLLNAIEVEEIDWELSQGKSLELKLKTAERYETQIAGLTFAVEIANGHLIFDTEDLDAALVGKVVIGELEGPFRLEYANGKATASAQIPNLNLSNLSAMLGLPIPSVPGFDLVDELLEEIELRFRGEYPVLIHSIETGSGPLRCVVQHFEGAWCLVAGLYAPNFRFQDLNSALAPLDAFSRIVQFDDPVVTYADRSLTSVPYPSPGGGWGPKSFEQGFKINGTLLFEEFGLDFLEAVFGIDSLPLAIPIGDDWSQVKLAGRMQRPLRILGDLAVLEDFTVSVAPDPQAVAASGDVIITLFGAKLPRFTLAASLTANTSSLALLSSEAWEEPIGIPVTVEEMGFQVSSQGGYGILGAVLMRDRRIDVATEFIGNAPTFFAGSLQGEMPLGDILLDIVGVDLLPDFIQPTIKDFDLYIVLNPAGASIATRIYPFGLSLKGTLSFLGLGFSTDIHLSRTRLRAIGELDGPIRMEPFFRLTGIEGPTPSFAIDTAENPVARIDGKVLILGLEETVSAVLGSDGFSARIEKRLGAAHSRLNLSLGDGVLAANGDVSCMITGRIGPIRPISGGPDLGTIKIDTGAEMAAQIRIEENGPFSMNVEGRIVIAGLSVRLPTFAVDISSMEQLPGAILEYIRDNAVELLEELLGNAEAWLRALAEGFIEAVEDVAKTLSEFFEKSAKEVADAMINVLDETLDITAKGLKRLGQTAEQIGKIFNELGKDAEEIAVALKVIGTAPEVIGNVLKELGRGAEEVGRVLEKIGFPEVVVDTTLRGLFPGVPDIGWPPHLKHIKLPHLKHIKAPHVKHIKAPHVKHIKAPHLKHIKAPHVKL